MNICERFRAFERPDQGSHREGIISRRSPSKVGRHEVIGARCVGVRRATSVSAIIVAREVQREHLSISVSAGGKTLLGSRTRSPTEGLQDLQRKHLQWVCKQNT